MTTVLDNEETDICATAIVGKGVVSDDNSEQALSEEAESYGKKN